MPKQFLRRYFLEVIVGLSLILILLAGLALGGHAMPSVKAAPAHPQIACTSLPPCW